VRAPYVVLLVAACSAGGSAPRSEATPASIATPTPDVSSMSTAIAERERACAERLLVMETFAECPALPADQREQLRAEAAGLRGDPGNAAESVAWEALIRDGCFQAASAYVDAAVGLGCTSPATPELDAWKARPFDPALATAEDECAHAAETIDAYLACPTLSASAIEAGQIGARMVELSAKMAARSAPDHAAAASRCRYTVVALARLAAEASCAGFQIAADRSRATVFTWTRGTSRWRSPARRRVLAAAPHRGAT
jgi:hypothetical protein